MKKLPPCDDSPEHVRRAAFRNLELVCGGTRKGKTLSNAFMGKSAAMWCLGFATRLVWTRRQAFMESFG
jgi:hypothetical protein